MMNEQEIWKPIEGWEGLYEVSNFGRVKSFSNFGKKGGFLTPRKDKNGYLCVRLWRNGVWYQKKVHRLVAIAFLQKETHKNVVDHINTEKDDNRVENLRWCTIKENTNNPLSKLHQRNAALGRKPSEEAKKKMSLHRKGELNFMFGKKHTLNAKIKMSRPIIQLTIDGEFIAEYYGVTEASQKTGIHRQNISEVLNGRRKHARGFLWKYKDK